LILPLDADYASELSVVFAGCVWPWANRKGRQGITGGDIWYPSVGV